MRNRAKNNETSPKTLTNSKLVRVAIEHAKKLYGTSARVNVITLNIETPREALDLELDVEAMETHPDEPSVRVRVLKRFVTVK